MAASGVRRDKAALSSGCKPHPATAPARGNWSRHGGDEMSVSRSYFTRLVRLSYLAPDITQAILDGRQPRDLTAVKLLEHSRLPLAWRDQRIALGFA